MTHNTYPQNHNVDPSGWQAAAPEDPALLRASLNIDNVNAARDAYYQLLGVVGTHAPGFGERGDQRVLLGRRLPRFGADSQTNRLVDTVVHAGNEAFGLRPVLRQPGTSDPRSSFDVLDHVPTPEELSALNAANPSGAKANGPVPYVILTAASGKMELGELDPTQQTRTAVQFPVQ